MSTIYHWRASEIFHSLIMFVSTRKNFFKCHVFLEMHYMALQYNISGVLNKFNLKIQVNL